MRADSNVDDREAESLNPLDLAAAANAIRMCWSRETSACTTWTPAISSLGQCAVTALLIQEIFGGDLLRAIVAGESHYWNRFPDGTELDLTRDQFDQFTLDGEAAERDRSYVLSYPDTAERYRLLRAAVLEVLALCA